MESVTDFTDCGYVCLGVRPLAGRLEIRLNWPGRVEQCSRCQSSLLHSHGSRERRVSHAPLGRQPCDLLVRFRRFRCQQCLAVHSPRLPLLAPRERLSPQLRDFIAFACLRLRLAFQPLRRWLGLGWSTLRRCLPRAPEPLDGARTQELQHLCLDEVFFREPRRYLTVLSCSSGRVLGLAEGRGAGPSELLLRQLPGSVLDKVETLATDLSLGQRQAACNCLPNALVCADHFHVARLLRRTYHAAPPAEKLRLRPLLRKLKAILRSRQAEDLQEWLDEHCSGYGAAFQSLHRTLSRWQLEIESAMETGRSTGPAEALNRKIALLRRLGCGYTNLDNFIQRILWLNHSPHH